MLRMLNVGVPRELVIVVLPLAIIIMGDSLMYIVLPGAFEDFGVGKSLGLSAGFWVGLALSVNRFVRLFSNQIAPFIYERFGLRSPFVAAVILGVLTTLAYALSTGIALLLIARLLWGVSYSLMRLASQIVAFRYGSDRDRGKYLGFYNMGQRSGSIIAVTAGAWIATKIGSQETFALLAGVGVIGVGVALAAPNIGVPSLRSSGQRDADATARSKRSFAPLSLMASSAVTGTLQRRIASLSFMRFTIAFAANGLAIATVSPYVGDLLADGRHVFGISIAAITLGGLLVGTRWFGDLALSIPFGSLSDRIGRSKSIVAAIIVMMASLTFIAALDSPELFVLLLPVMFFASILANTSLDASVGESVDSKTRSAVFARYSTWQDLGGALGPLLGLSLAEMIGFQGGYFLAAAALAVSLITYVFIKNVKIHVSEATPA